MQVVERLDSVVVWQIGFHTAELVVVESVGHGLTGTGRTMEDLNEMEEAAER